MKLKDSFERIVIDRVYKVEATATGREEAVEGILAGILAFKEIGGQECLLGDQRRFVGGSPFQQGRQEQEVVRVGCPVMEAIVDTVLKGGQSGEIAQVGRESPGGGGVGLRKEDAGLQELAEEGGSGAMVVEHRKEVVSKSVKDEEEDVGVILHASSPCWLSGLRLYRMLGDKDWNKTAGKLAKKDSECIWGRDSGVDLQERPGQVW